jgi:hypothetical protein
MLCASGLHHSAPLHLNVASQTTRSTVRPSAIFNCRVACGGCTQARAPRRSVPADERRRGEDVAVERSVIGVLLFGTVRVTVTTEINPPAHENRPLRMRAREVPNSLC